MSKRALLAAAIGVAALGAAITAQQAPALPSKPLHYGFFTITFGDDGSFSIVGKEWPAMKGTWKLEKDEVVVETTGGSPARPCTTPGRYKYQRRRDTADAHDGRGRLRAAADGDAREHVASARRGRRRSRAQDRAQRPGTRADICRSPKPAAASWPSFRGPNASGVADGQNLPDPWDVKTGNEHPLAHADPRPRALEPGRLGRPRLRDDARSAARPNATFKPGLYGDGDASDDRSSHKWMLYAIDKRTGKIAWERIAFEGEPRNKRHIKSTYASASPATDGRIVVAWFGSQGVHAYDVNGNPLWKVDIGRVDMGAYDIPSYEWGPASSPIIWKDLVFLQVRHAGGFVPARARRATGKTVWKTDRAGAAVVGHADRRLDRRRGMSW